MLLLAPHPDDETLGCGAALAALTAAGHRVQVIVITDGGHSHPGSRLWPRDKLCRKRADEVTEAVAILTDGQAPAPIMLGYPDNAAPDGRDAAQAAAAQIAHYMTPSTKAIWATWEGDPHCDHGRTARIATIMASENPRLALWSYPIWGRFCEVAPTPDPGTLVRFATDQWQTRKADAVAAHVSQMTGLITDDPDGFRMTQAHQRHFITTPELFIRQGHLS